MPVEFLTDDEVAAYGRFAGAPSRADLERVFFLDDEDRALVGVRRGEYSQLGFALQLVTVRWLGTFLEDPVDVPVAVADFVRWVSARARMGRFDASDSLDQGCGIRKCATTVRNRTTGTVKTTIREVRPSQRFARGRSNSPTMTVASNAKRMPALINDARTGNNCGGHTAGRLAEQAQPGRTGCAIQSTNKPRRTTQAATTGERVAPRVLLGMSPDYRSGTPVVSRAGSSRHRCI